MQNETAEIWVLPLLLTLVCSVGCGGKRRTCCTAMKGGVLHGLAGTYLGAQAHWHANLRERQLHRSLCRHMSAGTGKRCGFRRVQLAGKAAASHGLGCCQSGFVQLIVKNGSDELWLTPDANGNISQEITGSGGDWYLSVEYADFSGSVTLCSAYAK